MSFRFNFAGDDSTGEKEVPENEVIQWQESEEVVLSNQIKCLDDMVIHAKMFTCGDVEIGHRVVNEALANMTGNTLNASILAKDENSDLVTGKYEGGLKIWECTYDLLKYLIENEDETKLRDLKVLDLGCGAGILGIYTFLNGSFVTFQDYNKEVLEFITIPNVLLNIEEDLIKEEEIKRCNFFSGDWASFDEKLADDVVFDLILSSETIYNEINYSKLIHLFTKRLKANGKVYVAAKTCYFGVGGGIRQFEDSINKHGTFECSVCWKNSNGIQREILKITKKVIP